MSRQELGLPSDCGGYDGSNPMNARHGFGPPGGQKVSPVLLVTLVTLLSSVASAGAVPTVSNIRASQRESTKLVDVYYDLSGATPPVTVSVQVSTNAGVSYDLPASSFSGDVGAGGTNGTGLHIIWAAGDDWDGQYSPIVRFRVSAIDSGGSLPPGFVLIPAGNFQMGDSFAEGYTADERPVHTVYVSAFYMQATEVTEAQWNEVRSWAVQHGYWDLSLGSWSMWEYETIYWGKGSNHPVHIVTWFDVVKWCNARSEKEGLTPVYYTTSDKTEVYRYNTLDLDNDCVDWTANGYRLPTEAEWERAARGGASGRRFPWSDTNTITHSQANYYSSSGFAYDTSPTRGHHPDFIEGGNPCTSPVGNFATNGYGLYDMAGNVCEWCWDRYSSSYYDSSPFSDPLGPSTGGERVLRGGSWFGYAYGCRVAAREYHFPGLGVTLDYFIGFRPVRR